MPVNPSEQEFFDFLGKQAEGVPHIPVAEQTVEDIRNGCPFFLEFSGKPAEVTVSNTFVPARDGYQIPIRIFNHELSNLSPVFIMYPGCGYVCDLFESNAIAASRIAKHAGIKVVIVNFRLAPENPLPGPIYDAYDATKYLATHAKEFGIDPNKILIGGLSSGAHCAAVISSLARNDEQLKIQHQILLNGSYDLTRTNHAYDDYEKEEKMCTREIAEVVFKYWATAEQYTNPLISPVYDNLEGLPKTTILVGEYDGLRNDSETYYEKLKASGNDVQKIVLPGQTHNTIILREAMLDGEDPALVIANVIAENI